LSVLENYKRKKDGEVKPAGFTHSTATQAGARDSGCRPHTAGRKAGAAEAAAQGQITGRGREGEVRVATMAAAEGG
jgi:hypothetical protein